MTTKTSTEKWYIVDADGKVLGKVAERIATILRGKHKVTFDPAKDCSDGIIVINAEKIRVTGNKEEAKLYSSHSRYPGGFKQVPLSKLRAEKPEEIILKAVKGMMPKNKLANQIMTRHLKVYAGNEHPHAAQQPTPLEI